MKITEARPGVFSAIVTHIKAMLRDNISQERIPDLDEGSHGTEPFNDKVSVYKDDAHILTPEAEELLSH